MQDMYVPCWWGGNQIWKQLAVELNVYGKDIRRSLCLSSSLFLWQVPLTFAVGEALHVEKNVSPSPEQVDALHSQFCDALTEVFDRFKGDYGWGDKELELRWHYDYVELYLFIYLFYARDSVSFYFICSVFGL